MKFKNKQMVKTQAKSIRFTERQVKHITAAASKDEKEFGPWVRDAAVEKAEKARGSLPVGDREP